MATSSATFPRGKGSAFGVTINGPMYHQEYQQILTDDAMKFLVALHKNFESTRRSLLKDREKKQRELSEGKFPDFLPETRKIRESNWKVAPLPKDLLDRRVEITGPVSRKMVINALNSGAKVFMADFEDSNSPTWENNMDGQINLRDAVNRAITFQAGPGQPIYKLNPQVAVLMVRPRGWHLEEAHFLVNGEPMSGSLFDFGLYFFHNAKNLLKNGTGPYFYLPKMESHREARLWNEVFTFSEKYIGIRHGTIKATVLIETILASFEMDEILYELKDHSAGLNCGRWDYIFSYIKKFYDHPQFLLPDRAQVTMTQPFMNAYVQLLIRTCHRRGVHAMGGMAAQIPIKNNEEANRKALEKVVSDKLREVKAGHDGTWVAHPGLVSVAMKIFNENMKTPNQIHVIPDVHITAKQLLESPEGTRTLEGIRSNVSVSLLYLEAWVKGNGCVPIHNLMEDLATAEISRSQLQQWIKHGAKLDDGNVVGRDLVMKVIEEETNKLTSHIKDTKHLKLAQEIFTRMIENDREFGDFMSLIAYPYIITPVNAQVPRPKL